MLWAYFDESGLHKPNGDLDWLVLGGAIATEENWQLLSSEWETALREFEVLTPFHMKDFEAHQPPFARLGPKDHKSLLNRLLCIQSKFIKNIVGVTNAKATYRGPFRKIYKRNLEHVLVVAAEGMREHPREKLSVVFARHPEIGLCTVLDHFGLAKQDYSALADCKVDEPSRSPPLQMADLIAYELSHCIRDGRDERYPYRCMKQSAKVTLFLLGSARSGGASFGRGRGSIA